MRVALPLVLLSTASCALFGLQPASESPSTAAPAGAADAQVAPPAPPPDPDAALKRDVAALRAQLPALLGAQADLLWKGWALGEPVDLPAVAKGYPTLLCPEALRQVRAMREKTQDPEQVRALRMLERFLVGELASQAAVEASDAVARLVATETVSVDGQELPFRDLEALLASEGHTGKRRKIWAASETVVRKLAAPLLRKERLASEALGPLGYATRAAWAAELRQVELAPLGALAQAVLAATEAPYLAALADRAKREVGLGLADLRRSDAPRLFRTGLVDTYFPREKAEERLATALAGLGLDAATLPQLKLDATVHAGRSPRALAVVLAPGKDVRLSLRAAPGLGAAAQLFYEAGHGVAQALRRTEVGEFAWLGPAATQEAAGYLFEGLLDHPGFAARAGVPESKLAAHVRLSALRRLFLLRLHAGRVLFEVAWRTGAAPRPEEAYREVMTRALGFPSGPEDGVRWLADVEDLLGSADSLRALLAASQLEAALEAAHGAEWWADPRSGAKLAEWFAAGGRPTVEELVQAATGAPLDPAVAAAVLERRLKGTP